MGLVCKGDSTCLSCIVFNFSLFVFPGLAYHLSVDVIDFLPFSVLRLPGVGRHVYGHMLWRFQCPHLYSAKLFIKDLIEKYFKINAALGFYP